MRLQPQIQVDPAANIPAGKVRYSIIDLGFPVKPDGINDTGQIIAHTENTHSLDRAYQFENGKRTILVEKQSVNSTRDSPYILLRVYYKFNMSPDDARATIR